MWTNKGLSILLYYLSILPLLLCQETDVTPEASEEDIPADEVSAAYYIDFGRYSTQSFDEFNWQQKYYDEEFFLDPAFRGPYDIKGGVNHTAIIDGRCSAQYVRCIVNIEIPYPVCGWNQHDYRYYENYCHVYLDNCFLYYRHYRIIAYGDCWGDGKIINYPKEHKPIRGYVGVYNSEKIKVDNLPYKDTFNYYD